jgi:hypothetical protein
MVVVVVDSDAEVGNTLGLLYRPGILAQREVDIFLPAVSHGREDPNGNEPSGWSYSPPTLNLNFGTLRPVH